ncbi:MAG: MFS transporter [Methanocorpusculum sp.]|nr:MFS transporter [Methanocorpusculum sp.]
MYSVIKDKRLQRFILLIAAFAIFMDGLDSSIVNVALPVIASEYGVDISGSSWVVMAYLVLMAGFILAFGKIADNGRIRQVFAIGFGIFALGSFICAVSPNLTMMIAARAVQGLGASMIAAAAPLLITRFLPENKRGFGMGVIATTGGIALTLGPPLGGFITEYLSWHWIFLINVPIGIAAIIAAKSAIPSAKAEKEKFDAAGTVLMFIAIASMIMFFERGPSLGWFNPQIILLGALCAVTLLSFCIYSVRAKSPILNVSIFRNWKFSAVTISYLLTCAVFAGVMYMVPYYMYTSLSLSTAVSGLLLMISSIITACVGIPIGSWSDKVGCKIPCILAALFRISFCVILLFITPELGVLALIPALICMGFSFGISGGPATTRIVQHSPKGEEGSGTSVMITSDFLGGVIGVAAYALIFSITVPQSIGTSVSDLTGELFLTGFHATAALGLVFGIITLILSSAVPNLIVKKDDSEN